MYRTMWNPEMEAIGPDAQRVMELEKFASQLEFVYASSPFYRRKFDEAGLAPADVRSADDLARLPLTDKAELRESQEREPPYGDYLAADREHISTVHRTSGSTGKFIYTVLTRGDMAQTNECGARAFWSCGLRPHHTVVHCLNYSMWMGGYTDHRNLEATGAAVVPFGVGNSRELVRRIREASVDVISATPSYPNHLESVVREELGIEPDELGLELGLLAGEPGLERPAFKQRIEETWGMRASNSYGMSDVISCFAAVCEDVDELHFVGQGVLLAQIADPNSAEVLPLEPAVKGELVLTHLERQAQPLVRYRTGDVVEVLGVGPCRCGRTGFRFAVAGRSDDMVHVRGVNVFPSGVADVLAGIVPDVTGEFQIVLSDPGPYDRLEITVERGKHVPSEQEDALRTSIEGQIRRTLGFGAKVSLVDPGAIPTAELGKAARLVRNF